MVRHQRRVPISVPERRGQGVNAVKSLSCKSASATLSLVCVCVSYSDLFFFLVIQVILDDKSTHAVQFAPGIYTP